MYAVSIENSKGEVLELTNHESEYQVLSISGLNPPKAQINMANYALLDGSKFNTAKLETRNIVLTLRINGDVESNRLLLYRYFITKDKCIFYYKNSLRDVRIEGYVESVECGLFSNSQVMQISIICPNSYFKSLNDIISDLSKEQGAFEFPFAFGAGGSTDPKIEFSSISLQRITKIVNDSESETGINIEAKFKGSVSRLVIRNVVTGDSIIVVRNFIANDTLLIDTNKGQKSINLIRNGVKTNIFSNLDRSSKFFSLSLGENYFGYLADNGSSDELVKLTFSHSSLYRGV